MTRCGIRLGAVCMLVLTLLACARSQTPYATSLAPIVTPLPVIQPEAWAQRGTVVGVEPLRDVQDELRNQMSEGVHVTYRSVSGVTGEGTVVSGALLLPKREPPPEGLPVIAVAHGFTGLNTECGPSGRPDFLSYATTLAAFLSGGVALAFTDYQGLGGPGLHPFLEPRTAAFNVIDSVRALKAVFPTVSNRWLAFGVSQGGQASWAVDELNGFYGDGFDLLGSAALAPAANMSAMAQMAYREALTPQQLLIMVAVVTGAERAFPATPVGQLLHGRADADRDLLNGCGPDADQERAKVTASDVKPDTSADAASLADSLRKMALPLAPISAPMLVVSGLADQLVLPEWIAESVDRACKLGGRIEHIELPDATHGDVGPSEQTTRWMLDRFDGKPAPNTCAQSR